MDKKIIKNFLARILLFIFVTLLLATLYYKVLPILNAYGVQAFYINDYTETENFKTLYRSEIAKFESLVQWDIDLDSYNETSFDYLKNRNTEYILDIELTNGETMLLSNISDNKLELHDLMNCFEESDRYYICKLNSNPETSEDYLKYTQFHADQSKFKKLDVYMRIQTFEKPDEIANRNRNYNDFINNYKTIFILCTIYLVISILLLIYITSKVENKKNYLDSMYFEEIIIGICLIYSIGTMLIRGETEISQTLNNLYKYIVYFISYIFLFEAYLLLIKRIKFKDIKDNIMFPKIGKNMDKLYKIIGLYVIILISVGYFFSNMNYFYSIAIQIVLMIILHALSIRLEIIEISEKIENISNGNFDIKLKSRSKICEKLVRGINNIQKGMKEAVDEKVKSERLKTDLITNVSHDLKTPLTSIMNYTKLLKKENLQNEKARKYIEILENKSIKLKNLTEDLIEISKLSSGNESVNLERLNFAEMVLQANGEFAEKFEEKGLNIISDFTSEEIYTNLDSKKMWRVLENIYSNIYKYSLENTRVYIQIKEKNDIIEFTAKNISKQELNIDSKELMERFVRGEKSRTDEGNGLGLSIAKELVELQGGKFNIYIEGDLFKISIIKGKRDVP